MFQALYCTVFLSVFYQPFLSFAHAQESIDRCLSCEDVQHAVNLTAIETRLWYADNDSLELLDNDARSWYSKFQKGGWLFDGWQEISEDVVAKVPDNNKIKAKATMHSLGVKIGYEWSKENSVRKISTEMLQDWGKRLRKTVADSPENLVVLISSIESEVDELLF